MSAFRKILRGGPWIASCLLSRPAIKALIHHLIYNLPDNKPCDWPFVTPPNSMSIPSCHTGHISCVLLEYTVQAMQATQNNLGLFRVFKPTILFHAPSLPSLQQIFRPPDLGSSTAFWKQSVTPIGFTTPPPPVNVQVSPMSFCAESQTIIPSICVVSQNSDEPCKNLKSAPVLRVLEESAEKSNICGVPALNGKTRKKKYPCPLCDIRCSNNGQLQGHLRIHTGEKPFQCTFDGCDRRFARNEELTRHKRIHTGVRPHKCEICNKAFGRKDHLSKHQKTHLQTAEKKVFTCVVLGCGQKYSRSDALTRHQWTAHSLTKASSRALKRLPRDAHVLRAVNPCSVRQANSAAWTV